MVMTEQEKLKFAEIVYQPYVEAWNLMKKLRDSELDWDKAVEDYIREADAFKSKYKTEIGASLYRVIIDTPDEIKRLKSGKYN